MRKPTSSPTVASGQVGAAMLLVSLIILFLITLVTTFANRNAVFEQRTSANHYRYTLSFEAAQAGVNYAVAWLATSGNTSSSAWSSAWVADTSYSPYTHKNTTSIAAQTVGAYVATTTLWRSSANTKIIEIATTSSGEATADVKQIAYVLSLSFNVSQVAPLVVNGCISGVTGNPSITGAAASGDSIVTSGAVGCSDTGHLSYTGNFTGSAFTGTAWDYIFGISKSQMSQLASAQSGGPASGPIYYYTDSTVSSYSPSNLGSSASPILLIFDISSGSCPKINGGVTLYGIAYCGRGFDMQGWGGTTIHGSLVTDTSMTKFTANTNLVADATANNTGSYSAAPIVSKVTGSWRDF